MPAIIPFIPLIVGAVSAGATVAAAHSASSGATDAAETNANAATSAATIQGQSTREALDFQKQKLAEEDARLAPYRAVGGNAISHLGSLWGLSSTDAPGVGPQSQDGAKGPYNPTTGLPASVPGRQGDYPLGPFVPASQGQQGGSMAALGAQGPAAPQSSGFISMISPTGETGQVPAALKDYYLGKGAQLAPQGATV